MCRAQLRELEPADDVLGGHLFERLSQGIVDGILVPRRDPAEVRLDLRPESLDRRVVRAVGAAGAGCLAPASPDGRRRGMGLRGGTGCPILRASPACSSGTSTLLDYYDSNAVGSVDPDGTYPVQTQRGDHGQRFHEPGAEPNGPLAVRGPAVGPGHRRGHPDLSTKTSRFGSTRFTFLRNDRRSSRTSGRSRSSACWVSSCRSICARPDRRQAAVEAAPLLQLVQGVVVVLPDQIFQ